MLTKLAFGLALLLNGLVYLMWPEVCDLVAYTIRGQQ